jgi:molybdopterin converting factor small subunit
MTSDISTREVQAITVRVTLFADLRKYLQKGENGPFSVSLPTGATVADLLAHIGIMDAEAEEVTAGRNGDQAQHDAVLQDGDDIVFFSPMEGG